MSNSSNLKLDLTSEGRVVIVGETAETNYDKELQTAIEDPSVEVNLYTTRANSVTIQNANVSGDLVVGAFGGSNMETRPDLLSTISKFAMLPSLEERAPTENVTTTEQHINLKQASKEKQIGGVSPGQNVFHEVMESYYAAKNSPGNKNLVGDVYKATHQKAISCDAKYKESTLEAQESKENGRTTISYYITNPENGKSRLLFTK